MALVLNWFGDSLDGTVARVRRQSRPRYGMTSITRWISRARNPHRRNGRVRLDARVDRRRARRRGHLVAAETYLATHAGGVFRLAFAGVGPTELRIVLAIGAFAVARRPWVDLFGVRLLLLDAGAVVAIGGLAVAFIASAIRTTRTLYRAEPLPRRGERAA